MADEPVMAHEQRVYVANESTWGTAVLPATAQSLEVMTLDMGATEQGVVRPKRDKTVGRDMQLAFTEGRVEPIAFTLEKSLKSRAAAASIPEESAILKAAGLTQTVGATVVYTFVSAPTLTSLGIYSVLGAGSAAYEAEHGLGGLVKQLSFSGGDGDLTLKASGAFSRKNFLGQHTGTLIDAADTTLAIDTTAGAQYRIGLGYYVFADNAEIVLVTAMDYATGIATVTRGVNGTTAAAHSSIVFYPYQPTFTPPGVAPISEANLTVTLDSIATRCTQFSIDITTGMDHLPGESGSKYVQGGKILRLDAKVSLDLVLTKELVQLLGKANQRKSMALTIACGTGTGGVWTFSFPTTELEAPSVPAPSNDVSTVSLGLRCRGNSGNDLFSATAS